MFYSAKNLLLKINDAPIIATEAQLNYEAQITPYIEVGQRHADTISPDNTIQGTLNFSYYYTGADPIKNLIYQDTPLSFDFGGIKQTGYLKSLNVRFNPHNPITCTADITFFRSPSGSFTPVYSETNLDQNPVHLNEVTIYNFNNQYVTGSYLSANIVYSTEIRPEIHIGEEIEERGVFGIKETTVTIICDNLNPLVRVSGEKVAVAFGLKPLGSSTLTETYGCTGFLTRKSYSARVEENLTAELTIRQFNLIEEAEIENFTPVSGRYNDLVIVKGKNFNGVASVFFDDVEATSFEIVGTTGLRVEVPRLKKLKNRIKLLTLA
jgi:hypothetical protein